MPFRFTLCLGVLSGLLLAALGAQSVASDGHSLDISQYLVDVKTRFQTAGIIDSLGIEFEPNALLDIIWPAPDGVSHPIRFYPGGHLTDNNTIPLPTFKAIGLADNNTGPFVVITVDPDAPTPDNPFLRSTCHFIGGNFYFDASDSLLKNRTEAASGWIRPAPSPASREHRFVFLLYEQPDGFDYYHHHPIPTRHFNLTRYTRHHGLGNPAAGTFAYVESNASCWSNGCQ